MINNDLKEQVKWSNRQTTHTNLIKTVEHVINGIFSHWKLTINMRIEDTKDGIINNPKEKGKNIHRKAFDSIHWRNKNNKILYL